MPLSMSLTFLRNLGGANNDRLMPDRPFTDPVSLAVSGVPAGASAGFSVNPVTPSGSTLLTVDDTGSAAAGDYTLVDGVSSFAFSYFQADGSPSNLGTPSDPLAFVEFDLTATDGEGGSYTQRSRVGLRTQP